MKRTIIDTEFTKKFNSIRMRYCGQKISKKNQNQFSKKNLI